MNLVRNEATARMNCTKPFAFRLEALVMSVTLLAASNGYAADELCEPGFIQIGAPLEGETRDEPATFTIVAARNGVSGGNCPVLGVEYSVNGEPIGTATSRPYSYTFSRDYGSYQITAKTLLGGSYGGKGVASGAVNVRVTGNAPPTLTLTLNSPEVGTVATAPATFTLSANASDSDGTVNRVEFYAGEALVGTVNSPPYRYTYPALGPGTYDLTATAYDNGRLNFPVKSASATVRVISNAAPSVTVSAKSAKAVAPADITVEANASDSDGNITKVAFFVNGELLNTDTVAPYGFLLSWLPEGRYSLVARATDNHGSVTASAPLSFTVAPPPVSVTRTYVYDSHQQPCKIIEPETGSTVMEYDGAGNLAWSAAGLSLPSTINCDRSAPGVEARAVGREYDDRNRLKVLKFPDGVGDQYWDYTPDGLPEQITTMDADSTTINHYSYNKRRLLETEGIQHEDPRAEGWFSFVPRFTVWKFVHRYNENGHKSGLEYPSGLSIDYAPNALGQPTQVGAFASDISYHPNGATAQFTYGNGVVHELQLNDRGLPLHIRDDDVVYDIFEYDANGNVASIKDAARDVRTVASIEYDGLDRLKLADSPRFGTATYLYDGLDNLRRVSLDYRDNVFLYDSANRLTDIVEGSTDSHVASLGYDPQGNLSHKNGQKFYFDFGNRLRSVDGAVSEAYRYDGHGLRVQTADGSGRVDRFGYGLSGQLLYDSSDRKKSQNSYVHLNGRLLARQEMPIAGGTAKVLYQHTDLLGSPVAETDGTRNVSDGGIAYEPFGKAINKTVDGVGYTGHVMDASTGLTYMQQRYYDPVLGRFLSVDPVSADTVTGWNFNRYSYAANNPYRFRDPDGRAIETVWDGLNVGMGVVSLVSNVSDGNYVSALIDAGGLVIDGAAAVAPFIPGGAATLIKAGRAADKAVDAVRAGDKALDAANKGGKAFSKEKQALVDMAKADKKAGGITPDDMQAYKDLNKGLPDPFPGNNVRGPEAHAPRTPRSTPGPGQKPHGHVGPVDHIPIKDPL